MPQLAHLIIHIQDSSSQQALEKFAFFVCQTSLHAALQLAFIFTAALEDFQPENPNGLRNPNANALMFSKCCRLLQNV